MSTRTLITGGSGYFGCLLRDRLLARGGSVRVFALVASDDRPAHVDVLPRALRHPAALRAACRAPPLLPAFR